MTKGKVSIGTRISSTEVEVSDDTEGVRERRSTGKHEKKPSRLVADADMKNLDFNSSFSGSSRRNTAGMSSQTSKSEENQVVESHGDHHHHGQHEGHEHHGQHEGHEHHGQHEGHEHHGQHEGHEHHDHHHGHHHGHGRSSRGSASTHHGSIARSTILDADLRPSLMSKSSVTSHHDPFRESHDYDHEEHIHKFGEHHHHHPNEHSLLVYDAPCIYRKPKVVFHLKFSQSQAFQVHKSKKDFTFYRKHDRVQCFDRALTDEELDELLDMIRAPKITKQRQETWKQHISRTPASYHAADELEEKLDNLLETRHARLHGVCNIRRQVYVDCFDEIIRQVALNTPERAVLLLRCRQEIYYSIGVFQALHGSAETYHGRYSILGSEASEDLVAKVDHFKAKIADLQNLSKHLLLQWKQVYDENQSTLEELKSKQSTQLAYLKEINARLIRQLDNFVSPMASIRKAEAAAETSKEALGGGGGDEAPPLGSKSAKGKKLKSASKSRWKSPKLRVMIKLMGMSNATFK